MILLIALLIAIRTLILLESDEEALKVPIMGMLGALAAFQTLKLYKEQQANGSAAVYKTFQLYEMELKERQFKGLQQTKPHDWLE